MAINSVSGTVRPVPVKEQSGRKKQSKQPSEKKQSKNSSADTPADPNATGGTIDELA